MAEQEFLHNLLEKLQAEGTSCQKLFGALRAGSNTVFHHVVSEAVTLDDGWITTLEAALFSVEKIVKNPRKFIAEQEQLVDVERARQTNSKTVRHLSSHTQYVRSVSDDGEVRPNKVLTTERVEDVAIYENRFVCTLIGRLVPFVEQRYREIEDKVNSADQTRVGITSQFALGTSQVECNLEVKVREQPHDTVLLERNQQLVERIVTLRKRLSMLTATQFMKQLSAQKPVRAPIQKTNLIRMNVDYRNCYELWLYISSYTFVGFSVQFQEKNLPVSGDYYDDLTTVAALSVQSLLTNQAVNRAYYDSLPYGEQKEKKFRTVTNIKFEPNFKNDKAQAGDEVVNEYYFKRMRDELVRATKRGEVTDERQLSLSFARFFRGIGKINNEMYEDFIRTQKPKGETLRRKSALDKKKQAVKTQQELLKRYHQLSMLRKEELERTLNMETRELLKLEKLKEELEKEQGKVKSQKARESEKKARMQRVKAKSSLAEERAWRYEDDLRAKDAERLAALEEQKRKKREEAQRKRDLKRLNDLKEKYDNQDN